MKLETPIGVFSIKKLESTPEYGALIGNLEFRGKGIGTLAKISIFKYWFRILNRKEIFVVNKKIIVQSLIQIL